MAVQLRFNLTGASGAIVHKNHRSARWSYLWIVDEVFTAAIGTALRVRGRSMNSPLTYEGPYFVVGLLDDLVYRIKKKA